MGSWFTASASALPFLHHLLVVKNFGAGHYLVSSVPAEHY